jgi:CRP-like cAMP-binding protein
VKQTITDLFEILLNIRMEFQYFMNYLRSRIKLDADCETALRARVKELHITKGTTLLYPGDLCKHLYFIKSGFFRVYTSDGFEDQTIDFATTDHFLTAINGFFNQRIGNEGIICEEDAVIFRINYYDWLALEDTSPQFLQLSKIILQESVVQLNLEKDLYRTSNSKDKYLYLGRHYPGIKNAISQKHIASYLGITGPTLSNLLKEMFRKLK